MLAHIRNSIARVQTGPVRGTGFLVAPDLVLTAFHVVGERSKTPPEVFPRQVILEFSAVPATGAALISSAGSSLRVAATVHPTCFDPHADWALLQVHWKDGKAVRRPLQMAEVRQDGVDWWTFGFPDSQPDGLKNVGTVRIWNADLKGTPALQLYCEEAAAGMGEPVGGFSGSPVLISEDEKAAVVGVLRSAIVTGDQKRCEAGTLYACPVAHIWESVERVLPGLLPQPALREISKPEPQTGNRRSKIRLTALVAGVVISLAVLWVAWHAWTPGQVPIDCGDGPRYAIDARQFVTQYWTYSVQLEARTNDKTKISMKLDPVQQERLSEAIQSANEFRKYVISGYNACAISKPQYAQFGPRFQVLDSLARQIDALATKEMRSEVENANLSALIAQYSDLAHKLGTD